MIVLFHGTEDDNTKLENWMIWVSRIMERYGDIVLTVPGVGSSQQEMVSGLGLGCIAEIDNRFGEPKNIISPNKSKHELRQALTIAGSDMESVINILSGAEANHIGKLGRNRRHEDAISSVGIKVRAAVAAACVLRYCRRVPAMERRPIRIIGHSRGGATAVALHNILSYYDIECRHTLTLDPCHGKLRLHEKDYYHKIWEGNLYNIPCEKEVGNVPVAYTFRPEITLGAGGAATIYNAPKLTEVMHGHMGKLEELTGSEAEKQVRREDMNRRFTEEVGKQYANAETHLSKFFLDNVKRGGRSDLEDRNLIVAQVVETLTSWQQQQGQGGRGRRAGFRA